MVTLIFGAGASFGSGLCTPKNPPLGNDLFNELVELGGAFSRLSKEIQDVFIKDGFEAGMVNVPDDNRVINPLQKELACYLSSFSVKNENAYVRLFNKLRTNIANINIVTLNYDILIEQALWSKGYQVDYNGAGQGITLLKPHGSSNFLPDLGGLRLSGNIMKGTSTFVDGLPTNAVQSHAEVMEWCENVNNEDISPIFSMYNKDKRVVMNKRLIQGIQSKYAELVEASHLIVLVGIKYIPHDEHIWGPLTKTDSTVLIVDPFPNDAISWAEQHNKGKVTVLKKGFEASVWPIAKAVCAHL